MESEKAGKWSNEEAALAVKAVLAGKGLKTKLRFKDLRSEISKGHTITDKTLDKALKKLLATKEIVREEVDGRALYSLSYAPTADDKEIFVKLDTMTIEGAVKIGALVNPDDTWSIYGIPKRLSTAAKRQLRQETLDFQGRVDAVLEDEWEQTVLRILERHKNDFTKKELTRFKSAFNFLFDGYSDIGDFNKGGFYYVLTLGKLAPRLLDIEISKVERVHDKDSFKKYAVEHGVSPEEMDKEFLKGERHGNNLRSFLMALKPKEREETVDRLTAIMQARVAWCAVVR